MVTNVTSLTGNGLKDWLIQRLSAIYFLVYVLFLLGFLFTHQSISYEQWLAWFNRPWFQIATALAFLSITLHSWIGIWTVTTDYMKCTVLRLSVQSIVALWLLSQFVWGLMIIWGR